jgi:hypothetical protein
MEQLGESTRTLPKQFAIGFGIAALLPLAVWYGVSLFHPPPEREDTSSYDLADYREAASEEKERLRQEKAQRKQELEEAFRCYYRDMFYAAYPVGILALIVGAFLSVQAVGAGLMFGGLFTLGEGCYCYWDKMGDPMRFGSLLIALVVVVALGCYKLPWTAGHTSRPLQGAQP